MRCGMCLQPWRHENLQQAVLSSSHPTTRSSGPVREVTVSTDARSKVRRTPDGRYLIVRGRLWRAVNPDLASDLRAVLVSDLMTARREVKAALRAGDVDGLSAARAAVNAAKISLGERGPVWWTDGAKDFNRHLVKNTPYAEWYEEIDFS